MAVKGVDRLHVADGWSVLRVSNMTEKTVHLRILRLDEHNRWTTNPTRRVGPPPLEGASHNPLRLRASQLLDLPHEHIPATALLNLLYDAALATGDVSPLLDAIVESGATGPNLDAIVLAFNSREPQPPAAAV